MSKSKKNDKKRAVTFQLVHRSQQDPLIADEDAPQRVLIPVETMRTKEETRQGLEKQHKHVIYFNDCDYLEHLKVEDKMMVWPVHVENQLRDGIEKAKVKFPSSVFPSEVEDEIGMLAKAAPVSGPQLHLDPDVVAAMDDDFDYCNAENQLEDNFIELADGLVDVQKFSYDEGDYFNSNFADETIEGKSMDESQRSFGEEETKSKFTNYSMTSSVMKRSEQLTLLDERFEKMYADYTDNEIGALDCDEIEGHVPKSADILLQYADEFGKAKRTGNLDKSKVTDKIKECWDANPEELVAIPVLEKDKWDCESILSTYSTLYNHPKLITESKKNKIQIDKRTGIPKHVLNSNKLTKDVLGIMRDEKRGTEIMGGKFSEAQTIISDLSTLSIRNRRETTEERKNRKILLKEYRKGRRLEKKLNAEVFKEEEKKLVKITINNRNNVQGNKII